MPPRRFESLVSQQGIVQVVLVYALFSALWILLSDRLLVWLFRDPEWLVLASTVKGWLFVAVTSMLLLVLLRRQAKLTPSGAGPGPESGPGSRPGGRRAFAGFSFPSLAGLVVVIAGFGAGYTMIQHRDTEAARLQAISELKVAQISDWLQDREEQAVLIQANKHLAELYYRWHGAGDVESGEELKTRLNQLRSGRGFSEVQVLGPSGHYLWSTGDALDDPEPPLADAAAAAMRDGLVHLVGPYLDAQGRSRLDFVVALEASLGAPPILVLHTDPSNWLFADLQAWPISTKSGEVLLLRRDGERIQLLNNLRYREDAALRLQLDRDGPTLAARLLRGEAEPGELLSGLDYRGVPAIGIARAVVGTDWFLLAKLDRSEVWHDALHDLLWITLASLLALLVAWVALSLLRDRERLARAEGVQHSQGERLRALSLLAAVADGSEDAIFAKDLQGRYTLCNRAACGFAGKSAQEILGRDDRALFPAEQAAMLMERDRQLVAEDRTLCIQEELSTVNGPRIFLTTKGPLRDAEGNVVGIFGIGRDVTERDRAERELRESESRFRALVEQSLAGIYIIQDGVFRYVNRGFAAIFGYDSAAAVMGRLTVTEFAAPEDLVRVEANIRGRLDGSIGDLHYTFTALRADGERIEVEVHGRGSEFHGRPAVIGLILDISARRASEEAVRQQADELARRNAELERFNEAMVGRELVMVALKQQINALSVALGREPPFQQPATDAGEKSHSAGEPA